jgi:hypothetical protein
MSAMVEEMAMTAGLSAAVDALAGVELPRLDEDELLSMCARWNVLGGDWRRWTPD